MKFTPVQSIALSLAPAPVASKSNIVACSKPMKLSAIVEVAVMSAVDADSPVLFIMPISGVAETKAERNPATMRSPVKSTVSVK